MINAGAALIEITPSAGLAMSGFAARIKLASGAHDPLTVRAIAVDDTAIVTADVLGLHEEMSRRIRERCVLPADRVIVAALHTHGGPASMFGRVGGNTSAGLLGRLEDACVAAIDRAVANRRPATMSIAMGADPDVARNRRYPGGIVDPSLPVLRILGADGEMIAVLVSYTCHPVVLGADNTLWTADYPHFVRIVLETRYPGAMAMFLTGCAGGANPGQSQTAVSLETSPTRTFDAARRVGEKIAVAARCLRDASEDRRSGRRCQYSARVRAARD